MGRKLYYIIYLLYGFVENMTKENNNNSNTNLELYKLINI